jgi:hypothetical protein
MFNFDPGTKQITDFIVTLFVDVHLSKAKHNLYLDSNCFLIAFTVTGYYLLQILLSVLVDGRTSSLSDVVHVNCISRMDIALHGR